MSDLEDIREDAARAAAQKPQPASDNEMVEASVDTLMRQLDERGLFRSSHEILPLFQRLMLAAAEMKPQAPTFFGDRTR